jgi:thymidylate kinase
MFATVIAFEGTDKSGKETQSKMLTHALQRYGDSAIRVQVPWNDRFTHRLIYRALTNGWAVKYPTLFQLLQFLNKFLFQTTAFLWLWLRYDFVILDRWSTSSIVYGDAAGANPYVTRLLYGLLFKPRLTVILHGTSFRRDTVDDDYEKNAQFQRAVQNGYKEWSYNFPFDHVVVSNTGTIAEVHDRVYEVVRGIWRYR